jgi:hypothetical protein
VVNPVEGSTIACNFHALDRSVDDSQGFQGKMSAVKESYA